MESLVEELRCREAAALAPRTGCAAGPRSQGGGAGLATGDRREEVARVLEEPPDAEPLAGPADKPAGNRGWPRPSGR